MCNRNLFYPFFYVVEECVYAHYKRIFLIFFYVLLIFQRNNDNTNHSKCLISIVIFVVINLIAVVKYAFNVLKFGAPKKYFKK